HGSSGIMSKEIIDSDYQNAIDQAGVDVTLEEYYELREVGGDEFQEVADEIAPFLGEFVNTNLDGTGPLVFVNRQAGSHVDLTRNDDYWGDLGNYVDVSYTVNTEAGSRMAELETGTIQVATALEPSSLTRVEQTDGLDVVSTESLRMSYLSFNTDREPFDDPLVRQAISYAIDREAIISGIYDDVGIPATSPLAPAVWGHNPDIESISYDMDEAQALLDQTEVADGFETTLWVYDVQQDIDKAVLIQESLANLGITVNIEQLELGAFLERTGNGEHDMFILGWTTVTADADYGMYALFHSDSKGAPGNRSFYENPEVDELLDAGRSEIDEDARYDIYTEVQEILAEDAPMAYLIHTNALLGVNTNYVNNILVDPVNYVRFHDVEFVE
ncbi:MAG TPA: ABC transporter substrate-binding protein, partial [Aliicoccus persicus]|nr:ABC transporter substrate-binding protein [Aliicoccus persicus]